MSASIRSTFRPLAQAVASSSKAPLRTFSSTPQFYAESSTPSKSPKSPKRPISSCPPGTVLSGLSVLKDKPDPVALPDDQYPSWLWTILDDSNVKLESDKKAGRADAADVDFKLQKRKLRAQNRADIKAANYLKTT